MKYLYINYSYSSIRGYIKAELITEEQYLEFRSIWNDNEDEDNSIFQPIGIEDDKKDLPLNFDTPFIQRVGSGNRVSYYHTIIKLGKDNFDAYWKSIAENRSLQKDLKDNEVLQQLGYV